MMKDSLKWIALIALVVQNSGLAIVMRYTFIEHQNQGHNTDPNIKDDRYITSTAVLSAEILKLIISFIACFIYDANNNITYLKDNVLYKEFVDNYGDFLKLMIPSVLYTIQNTLQYFSISCLSAPVFQVLYQMKIITTAIFSVLILAKRLGSHQWISVLALTIGVALVQLSQLNGNGGAKENSIAGLIAVLLGCLTSGFAGVYFEMVLKSSKASIWLRNIQLALIGSVIAAISCYSRDGIQITERGFFSGYNLYVWIVIFLQAAGGLLVAVVVKYADNVLKGFATSISIILSSIVSAIWFHDIDINGKFIFGAAVVLGAVYLYGYVPAGSVASGGSSSNSSSNV